MIEKSKKCNKCGAVKPLGAFWICATRKDGRDGNCAECRLEQRKISKGAGKGTGWHAPKDPTPPEPQTPMKRCVVCNETKPIDMFWRNRSYPDGRDLTCSGCRTANRKVHKPRGIRKTVGRDESRRCSICGERKPTTDFYPNKKGLNGYSTYCKSCQITKSKESYRRRKGYQIETVEYKPASALVWSYGGKEITLDPEEEWICLTDLWRAMGSPENKRPSDWLNQEQTKEYIGEVDKNRNASKNGNLFFSKGVTGSTWACYLIGLNYASYLHVSFGIWCNEQLMDYFKGHSLENPGKAAELPVSGNINSISIVPKGLEQSLFDGGQIQIATKGQTLSLNVELDIGQFINPEKSGFIYLVQDKTNPHWYKIGKTQKPSRRKPKEVYGQSPYEGERICLIKTTDYDLFEHKLQLFFGSLHFVGEWYRLRDEDLKVFEQLQHEFVDAAAFEATKYFRPLTGAQMALL